MPSPTVATSSSEKPQSSSAAGVVSALLHEAIAEGTLAGGVILGSKDGKPVISLAAGTKTPQTEVGRELPHPAISLDTVFDLGELTQSICTATLLMRLVSSGKISVSDRASRFLQALGVGQKSSIMLSHLLSHTAGFPSGVSVYDDLVRANAGPRPGIMASSGARQYAYTQFHNLPLKFEPGTRELVSDSNCIVLGEICEIITGLPLEKAYSRYVAAPIKVSSLHFIDLTLLRRKGLEPVVDLFAPSGVCSRRGRLIAGEVWDENAWVMGGVSGHSGLFGIARDVQLWALELLKGYRGESQIFTADAVKAFVSPETQVSKSSRKYGFDAPSKESGFVDAKTTPNAFVCASNTGCSVFIDPDCDMVIVFLSNAGFSGHTSRRFSALRADIHAALLNA